MPVQTFTALPLSVVQQTMLVYCWRETGLVSQTDVYCQAQVSFNASERLCIDLTCGVLLQKHSACAGD